MNKKHLYAYKIQKGYITANEFAIFLIELIEFLK